MRTFNAGHIATPISEAETIDLQENPKDAAARLEAGRFDQAPVVRGSQIVGWARADAVKGALNVQSVLRRLDQTALVSSDSSMADVLGMLGRQGFVFTVGQQGIDGFVTPSDLDRHAARSHFYLLIASVEMALALVVERCLSEEEIIAHMEGESQKRWSEASALGTETRPVEYLYLKDLATMFELTPLHTKLPPKEAAALTELCHLRPKIMHPVRPLVGKMKAEQLASLASRGEELLANLERLTNVTLAPSPPLET